MAKTKAKKKPAAPPRTAFPSNTASQLAETRRELRRLRELRGLLKTVTRARSAIDGEALHCAMNLLADTDHCVVERAELHRMREAAAEAVRARDEGPESTQVTSGRASAKPRPPLSQPTKIGDEPVLPVVTGAP